MKIDSDIMESAADKASDLLKALSNRHRLLIICQLIDGERSVGDLAEFLSLRDSTVSQHLALLRKDGLVAARRDAQTIYYSIASQPAREVLKTLYQVYCAPPKVGKAGRKAIGVRRRHFEAGQYPRLRRISMRCTGNRHRDGKAITMRGLMAMSILAAVAFGAHAAAAKP